jgi:zinc protease
MLLHNIIEKTLPNGLKVICLNKPGVPIVSMQLWYKIGSVGERDGIRGISHMLEHMMFRGSRNVGSEEHARRINEVGGHCNAFTSEDVTVYINSVPREYFNMVLELEADRMDGLQIENSLFDTERKVIIEEYHTYMNNPVAKAFLEFRHEFFANHPYSLSPLGLIENLQLITTDQCREYYSRWYLPNNAVLVIVGDIDETSVFDNVEKYFGVKKSGILPELHADSIPEHHGQVNIHRMKRKIEFDVPLLVTGYPAPASNNKDAVAMEILQLVLSGGESSRLHKEVVRKESVAVMTGGMNHILKYAGMSMFLAAFTPDMSVAKVERSINRQVDLIRKEGITEAEMEKVRNATLSSRTFELYSAENICNRIGHSECVEGDYRLWVARFDTLKKLDINSLIEVANKYWDDSKRHVLHLVPRKTNFMLYVVGIINRVFGKRK